MTTREFISLIRNDLNSVRLDDYISGESIYWKAVNFVQFFINRNLKNRKILNNSSLFSQKNCVSLELYKCDNCSDIPFSDKGIMRSVNKLPKIFQTNFGELISVYNINNTEKFKKTTLLEYINTSKRKFQSKNSYFYILNDYLYIPKNRIDKINISFLSFDLESVNDLSEECFSLLDLEFPCPSFLLSEVSEKTKESYILSKKLPSDEDSNLNQNDKV
jgi:hypothetical protein